MRSPRRSAAMTDVTVRTGTRGRADPRRQRAATSPPGRRAGDATSTRSSWRRPGRPPRSCSRASSRSRPSRIRTIPHGSTAVVTLAYSLDAFAEPPHGTRVPRRGRRAAGDRRLHVQLAEVGRARPGRDDPPALLRRVAPAGVLARQRRGAAGRRRTGPRDDPRRARPHRSFGEVARWAGQMPHYTVGHLGPRRGGLRGARRPARARPGRRPVPGRRAARLHRPGPGGRRGRGRRCWPARGRADDGRRPTRPPTDATTGPRSARPSPRYRPSRPSRAGRPRSASRASAPAHRARARPRGDPSPATDLSIAAAAPFGGPLVLEVGRARVALARSVAADDGGHGRRRGGRSGEPQIEPAAAR